jgi:predicted NodU family carbamoyl transferase
VRVLGISAFYHDSAAALIEDGRVVAAAQEERFTRRKFDSRYPRHAIGYCLEQSGVTLGKVDRIAFYDKPFLTFERLLETNPIYHELITRFHALTGCPILVNTSFNVRSEPIVCTPEEAVRCFMGCDIDLLVIGNSILRKEEQDPALRLDYKDMFEAD